MFHIILFVNIVGIRFTDMATGISASKRKKKPTRARAGKGVRVVTPEEVYQYVMTHECEFYPDKCKERHTWICPICGKETGANCAIVKLNHKDNDWDCYECTEVKWDKD
jgi:hypothetical protein